MSWSWHDFFSYRGTLGLSPGLGGGSGLGLLGRGLPGCPGRGGLVVGDGVGGGLGMLYSFLVGMAQERGAADLGPGDGVLTEVQGGVPEYVL